MALPFSRSVRALQLDRFIGSAWVLLYAAVVVGLWSVWFFGSRVTLYAHAETARLEVDRAVHRVDAPVGGRVVEARVNLGQEVKSGDLLLVLDSEDQTLQRAEEEARVTALSARIEAIRREIEGQNKTLEAVRSAAESSRREADARLQEAEIVAR